jgi:hypothetical protein
MNSVTIDGANQALNASVWCKNNFGSTGWEIDLTSMLGDNPTYRFDFSESYNATLFALRWL